ncbi:hypothetical protein IFO70_38895 [Phormidium tenue FACHB-886]|nr:hypothetical protein [Phormidium tenue FACHB-886]
MLGNGSKRLKIISILMATASLFTGGALLAGAQASDLTPEELLRICKGEVINKGGEEYHLDECVFEAVTETAQELEWHRVGDPVTNCTPGATQSITTTVGETRTDTETWSVGGSIGITIEEVLKIEGKSEYQQSRSLTTERRDAITVPPGRKNALTLGTGWVTQTGRMRAVTKDNRLYVPPLGSPPGVAQGPESNTFYVDNVTRRVPNGYIEKGQNEVGCDSKFTVDPEP